ncbi:MAG: hypothetical protein SFY32_17525 [Bacteroidota bacterium]|nr:hypothetical protein [Bacteroidota bacterium]
MEVKNKFFTFTDKNKPILEFIFTGNEPVENEVDEMIKCQNFAISQDYKSIVIYRAEKVKYLSADTRIKLGKWNKENKELIQSKITFVILHMHGMFGKMILNAIFLIQKPLYPYAIVTSAEEVDALLEKHTSVA